MALPDYFARNAVAASQVLAGFDEDRLASVLRTVRIGVTIGADACHAREGRAQLDLVTRIVARLYPTLSFRSEGGAEIADAQVQLARSINPNVEFSTDPTVEIIVGDASPSDGAKATIYSGSDAWRARISTARPQTVGDTTNPFGAGVAGCLAAANLFRFVFLENPRLDGEATFDAASGVDELQLDGSIGELVLVGAGAIGNAAAWALCRLPMQGLVHIVDHERVDLGNLQRYALTTRTDEHEPKAQNLARSFGNGLMRAEAHDKPFDRFVADHGYHWPRMLLALDSARDRRAAQASLPSWIANAWTQPGDLGVSTHDFAQGACVSCLYLPASALENEDAIVASSFGTPDRLMQIRVLLHRGEGVPRDLIEAIAASRGIPLEKLLPFEGRPIRTLYVEGFCGGAVIPLEQAGRPRADVHVPLAHQSALAGILLAAAAARDGANRSPLRTEVTRLDVLAPVPAHARQAAAKDPRGLCICQDSDYQHVYGAKYASQQASSPTRFSTTAPPASSRRGV